jgi:hypothetical protein
VTDLLMVETIGYIKNLTSIKWRKTRQQALPAIHSLLATIQFSSSLAHAVSFFA